MAKPVSAGFPLLLGYHLVRYHYNALFLGDGREFFQPLVQHHGANGQIPLPFASDTPDNGPVDIDQRELEAVMGTPSARGYTSGTSHVHTHRPSTQRGRMVHELGFRFPGFPSVAAAAAAHEATYPGAVGR